MQIYLPKINALRIGWNETPATEELFESLCKKHKIRVEYMPLTVAGFYHRHRGKNHIAISTKLGELQRRLVMFHEFGHYLMHSTGTEAMERFCGRDDDSRDELEANAFAYCALLPLRMLKTLWPEELAYEYGFGASFVMERLKVYERYGL